MDGRTHQVALLFPGQASQQVGMGEALRTASKRAREVYRAADAATGLPVAELCCTGTLDELTATEVTQVAVVSTSLAAAALLEEELGCRVPAVAAAGHSVGELAALGWAGALDLDTTLRLVHERGRLMARDAPDVDGTMVAVFGLGEPELEAICRQASQQAGTHAQIANLNAPGQVVISGERRAIEAAATLARAAGAQRIVPLNVAGPFHSVYMERAGQDFASVCATAIFRPPRVPVVLNTTATPTCDPEELRRELSDQITRRVQWVATLQCLAALGCTLFIELGPGRVLTNLVRRVLPDAMATAAGTPETLAEVAGLLKDQG